MNGVHALEANPVETEKSRRAGYPEVAVSRLSKVINIRGRAFFGGPGRVIELLDSQVGRQRAGGRGKHEGRHIGAWRLKVSAVLAARHHTLNCNAPGRRRFALNGAIISADYDWRAA
jgi:hypothetical protein